MSRPVVQTVYRSQLKVIWCPHADKFSGRGTKGHCFGRQCMAFVTTHYEREKIEGTEDQYRESYAGYCGETFGFIGDEHGEMK